MSSAVPPTPVATSHPKPCPWPIPAHVRCFKFCTFAPSDAFGWDVLSLLLQANILYLQGHLRWLLGKVTLDMSRLERRFPQVTKLARPSLDLQALLLPSYLAAQKTVSPSHPMPDNGDGFALCIFSILEKAFLGIKFVDS